MGKQPGAFERVSASRRVRDDGVLRYRRLLQAGTLFRAINIVQNGYHFKVTCTLVPNPIRFAQFLSMTMNNTQQPVLILASSSPYRRQVLEKLQLPFIAQAPDVDESCHDQENARQLVLRLAQAKARALQAQYPTALIIGSDQVAVCQGEILGKPGTMENAIRQLERSSGHSVRFETGLCLLNSKTGNTQLHCESFTVHFRQLSAQQIRRYLELEQPFNSAGSFKSEGLGICLFSRLEGDDPNALIGLPLIQLTTMLANEGINLPR